MESKVIGQPVNVSLHSSIQHPGQEKESQEIQLTGRYIEKTQSSYLKYEEKQNGGIVKTTVKMSKDDALIMRSGAIAMRLPFSLTEQKLGQYGNGPVQLKLGVKTKHIEFKEEPDRSNGRFSVHYELIDGEEIVGIYELTMIYTEGK